MIANSFLEQPDAYTLLAAYRPIRFRVEANTTVTEDQPMYADIYYTIPGSSSIFYKTISSYTVVTNYSGVGVYLFDIQDVVQELLQTFLFSGAITVAPIETDTLPANSNPPYHWNATSFIQVTVLFRGSSFDVNGLLVPGQGVSSPGYPVQGNATNNPVSGGHDLQSHSFYVLQSTLPPSWETIFDNDLLTYLAARQLLDYGISTSAKIYPLSNLPVNPDSAFVWANCKTNYVGQWDWLPVIFYNLGTSGNLKVIVEMYYNNGTTYYASWNLTSPLASMALVSPHTYYLPVGLEQIKLHTSGGDAVLYSDLINPANNASYRIVLYQTDSSSNVFESPMYRVGTSLVETTVLLFQNFFGHFESLTFARANRKAVVKSSDQFKTYSEDIWALDNPLAAGHKRFNVRANDEITLEATFDEGIMDWVKELFMSPMVLMQVGSGSSISYVSVQVQDDSFNIVKSVIEGRYNYKVSVKIRPALDYIQLRN